MSRQFEEAYFSELHPFAGWDPYSNRIEFGGVLWANIPGYEDYYVSELGTVVSMFNGEPHTLRPWRNQYGHLYVQLYSGKRGWKVQVHKLVAMMFNDNYEGYKVVRHLDDNPANNEADNLAWGTQADNVRDMIEHERNVTKPVYCFETGETFRACADAARKFNTHPSLITTCCQGKTHIVNGKYHFCYLEDLEERKKEEYEWTRPYDSKKPVAAINLETGERIIFGSRREASERLGVDDTTISSIIAGRFRQSKGWTFEDFSASEYYKLSEEERSDVGE